MESIDTRTEKYAVVFNVNLVRATLNEASEFKGFLDDAIADSDKDIIVNLSDCQHLDSTFLGLLVSSYKKLKGKNRNLVIIEPIDQSSVFLTLNSIGKIFPIYHDVKSALTDIENKRILEHEINNLGSEIESEVEIEAEPEIESTVFDEVVEEETLELSEEDISKPINLQETIQLQTLDEEHEDLITDSFEEEQIPQDTVEEPVEELEMQLDTMEDSIEEVIEEIEESPAETEFVENELQEEIVLNKEIEYEDGDFRKGSVKWEFGFN